MGIFSKKPIDPVEETSRRYLAVAPPVPRTEMLTASIIQRVRQLELADALQLGVVVSSSELDSVAALVREVMYQDLSLSVQVARKSTLWQDMIATLLAESYGSGLDLYFAANGVEWSKATPDSIRVEAASRPTGELQIEESSLVSMLSVALISAGTRRFGVHRLSGDFIQTSKQEL